ncbi:MAG TPA: sialidase family protein [Pyrinomonadaceae bacterium]|nr:sialidase family protein [Pyrinomonadaceae bacterium]
MPFGVRKSSARRNKVRFSITFSLFVAAVVAAVSLFAPLMGSKVDAAGAGMLSPFSTNTLTWTGTAPGGVALGDPLGLQSAQVMCQEGVNCDTFALNLTGLPSSWAGKVVNIKIQWGLPASDYDLYIHRGWVDGPLVASSGRGVTNPTGPLTLEDAKIDPSVTGTGTYAVRVVYYAATSLDQYRGSAAVEAKPVAPPPPAPSTATPPSFTNYAPPDGIGQGAGEPTLGANWATGSVMFIAGLETLRVQFNDSLSPATATWTDVSAPNTSITSFDPILFTDGDASNASRTNRTFVSQLLPTKVSLMAFTDNDGQTWTPSQGAGINSGVDHQTVGGGPYAKNADGSLKGGAVQLPGLDLKTYPNAVYYASQDIGLAQIARSDNGGLTFGPAVPMWNLTQCNGLHGHIKVAPDGTVYVPNKSCGGEQGVAVSEDNGLTWAIRTVPGSTSGATDPSVGIGADGTLYLGFADGDGRQKVAVSHNRGQSWEHVQDVGVAFGIQNSVFPAAVAGDADRAAVFFLGTTTPGDAGIGTDTTFPGTWYGYIATTYDGGQSWVTVNATPNDPVQRGVVCTNGTTCPSGTRNLLDFNDATIDKRGRVLAAYADGCITDACKAGADKNGDGSVNSLDNDGTDRATIIRQSGGKTLFAAFD